LKVIFARVPLLGNFLLALGVVLGVQAFSGRAKAREPLLGDGYLGTQMQDIDSREVLVAGSACTLAIMWTHKI
jgi:hypothetical protein